MAMEHENTTNYSIYENGSLGDVNIADEVVAVIAGIAATDVKGVAGMAGNTTKELISKLGMKVLSKGVRIDILDGSKVAVDLSLILDFGVNIRKVTQEVQDKVKSEIETMTSLEVTEVNIRVADVNFEEE